MKKSLALVAAAGLVLIASPAIAQPVNITNVAFNPGSLTGTIKSTPFNGNANIGRFQFTGNYVGSGAAFSELTYCIDLLKFVSLGTVNYSDYTVTPLSAVAGISAGKASALNALLTNAAPLLAGATGQTAANISAGTQMAVWEILYETGANWSVTDASSAFSVGGTNGDLTAARGFANAYLSNVASGSWAASSNFELRALNSPTRQSQVFLAAVPEPATWAMMILGFGAIGATLRRRRGAGATAFA
jgi:hypothetical protein